MLKSRRTFNNLLTKAQAGCIIEAQLTSKGEQQMSKMSQLHSELEQQAYEKGYESLDEALNDGATIVGEALLTKDDFPPQKTQDEILKAHKAWLKERGEVIKGLQATWFYLNNLGEKEDADNVSRAMKFIEEGEM